MKNVLITVTENLSAEDIHKALADRLEFPDTYGNNLDALYDCLTALAEETEIQFFKTADSPLYLRFLRVMQDAAEENPQITVITE